jgi:hypothetical protein
MVAGAGWASAAGIAPAAWTKLRRENSWSDFIATQNNSPWKA